MTTSSPILLLSSMHITCSTPAFKKMGAVNSEKHAATKTNFNLALDVWKISLILSSLTNSASPYIFSSKR